MFEYHSLLASPQSAMGPGRRPSVEDLNVQVALLTAPLFSILYGDAFSAWELR
jgi:hypothetical protein